jgi:WD40 repeat protein
MRYGRVPLFFLMTLLMCSFLVSCGSVLPFSSPLESFETEEVSFRELSAVEASEGEAVPWFHSDWERFERGEGELLKERAFLAVVPLCAVSSGVVHFDGCSLLLGIAQDDSVWLFSDRNFHGEKLGMLPINGTHFALSGKGDALVVSYRNTLTVLALPSLAIVKTMERIPADIQALDVSPYENIALVGGGDGRVYRWSWDVDVHPSEQKAGRFDVERYFAHQTVVSAVHYHPAGRVFFTGDWDGSVIAWKGFENDPFGGAYDRNIFGTGFFTELTASRVVPATVVSQIEAIEMNRNGDLLFVAYASGQIDSWRLRGLKKQIRFQHHRGAVEELALSEDGARVASYGRDDRIVITEIETKKNEVLGELEFQSSEIHDERVPGVHALFFRDKDHLLAIGEQGIRVFDIEDLKKKDNEKEKE